MLRLPIFFAYFGIFLVSDFADTPVTISSPIANSIASVGGNGDSGSGMISADGNWVVFTSSAGNLVTNDFNGFLDVFIYNRETRQIVLVSAEKSGAESGNGDSYDPVISDDGRFILFMSRAGNLVTNDLNQGPDIFLRDMAAGKTTLVTEDFTRSKSSTGTPYNPFFSRNTRRVVFESSDGDLVSGDVNGNRDLFMRDLDSGKTVMITSGMPNRTLGFQSFEPAISDDGVRVAYTSLYPNLVRTDINTYSDVFVWDGSTNIHVSISTNGTSGNQNSDSPLISGDGRYVSFHSLASNLAPGSGRTNWLLRDLKIGKTVVISTTRPIFDLDERATLTTTNLSLMTDLAERRTNSLDGKFQLITKITNQVTRIYLHDISEGTEKLISSVPDGQWPGSVSYYDPQFIGNDDRKVLFSGLSGTESHVFLTDLDTLETTLITKSYDGTPATISNNGVTGMVSASEDGRWIVYQAASKDIVTNTTRALTSIYLYDSTTQSNQLISLDLNGIIEPSGESFQPYISLDGKFVIFSSRGTNLVDGLEDTNNADDLFLRDVAEHRTFPITVAQNGTNTPSAPITPYFAFNPALSANGRYVAFQSPSPEIAGDDLNGVSDVFVRDTIGGSNILVSVTATGDSSGNGPSYSPLISADGRFVAFRSRASNLIQNGTIFETVYLRDLQEGVTTLLPGPVPVFGPGNETITIFGGIQLRRGFLEPTSVSSDARFEAYLSNANGSRKNNNTNAFQVYLADHQLGVTNLVSGNASGPAGWCDGSMPSITEDGRFVVFESMDSTLVENDHNHAMDVFLFDSASNHIDLISARSPLLPDHSANGYTTFNLNSLSANGERIVYTSWATNLVQNDTNDAQDVFLYDFSTGSNRLVSAGALMSPPAGASSAEPAISGNGLEIAFTTLATDLTDGDTNKAWDIFLQDSITGSNQLVSLSKEGTFLAKSSYTPSLSKDGRYLAFVSEALNVAEITDFNSASDVFVRDLLEGTTRLASVSTNLSKTPSAASYSPVISPDGNHVAFISKALGIVREGTPLFGLYLYNINEESLKLLGWARFPGTFNANSQLFLFETLTDQPELGDTNNYSDVFLYDLAQEKLELISINLDATSGNAASHIGSITPDGRYVVFTSAASDLATNDNNGTNDVFLRDRVSGVTILISHNSLGEAANGDSDSPSISSDGKLIAYRSSATDLVDDEIRAGGQIYVYDVTTGQTRLITRSISGNRSSNARAGMPLIRPDGSGIIFKSFATDIVPTKGSSSQDIYYVSLLPGALEDSDMDGLPDGWERSYFGDLTHNGSVDTDSDGQSDLAEFLCGTDPKNTQSVFAGTGIGTLEDGKIVLQWASQPGKRYLVQFKDSLNAEAWTNVGEEIEATTTLTQATDPSSAGNPHRYYRIMLVH